MFRFTYYDEIEKGYYGAEESLELEVRKPGEEFHVYNQAYERLGELEDFMVENGFETVDDLKNNFESKRIDKIRGYYEAVLYAYRVQHENDVKELEAMKKHCVKEMQDFLRDLILEFKRFYKTNIDGTTYVRLNSIVSRLKGAKYDVEKRL